MERFNRVFLCCIINHSLHLFLYSALTESRADFALVKFKHNNEPNQVCEQVWFLGEHTEIGGGLEVAYMSDVGLLWMIVSYFSFLPRRKYMGGLHTILWNGLFLCIKLTFYSCRLAGKTSDTPGTCS